MWHTIISILFFWPKQVSIAKSQCQIGKHYKVKLHRVGEEGGTFLLVCCSGYLMYWFPLHPYFSCCNSFVKENPVLFKNFFAPLRLQILLFAITLAIILGQSFSLSITHTTAFVKRPFWTLDLKLP